jgi:hypothetical protein
MRDRPWAETILAISVSDAVQLLFGHTKLESTVRYLGIEVDDALEIAKQTEICESAAL